MNTQNTAHAAKNKGFNKKREPKPPKKITEKYLYNAGLAYLQRFTASSAHFQRVMQRKIDRSCKHHIDQSQEHCQKSLLTVVERFKELGLLDDAGYTKGMVRSFRLRGLSSKSILFKLRQKGLDSELIQNTLNEIDAEENTNDLIAALRLAQRKKIGPFCEREKSEDKQLGQLARAGYNYEISRKVLSTSKTDAEEKLSSSF